MTERMYIDICDPGDPNRIVTVPRAGAIVTETSEVRGRSDGKSEQVPVTRLRYEENLVIKIIGVTRRDVVDALESGVGINGAWAVNGVEDHLEQMRAVASILQGERDSAGLPLAAGGIWDEPVKDAIDAIGPSLLKNAEHLLRQRPGSKVRFKK